MPEAATLTWHGRNPLDRKGPLPLLMLSKVQGANRLKGVPVERCRGVSSQLRAAEQGRANMTTYTFLTRADIDNYGSDLVDFAQRAAAHAMAPHLESLNAENAELRQRLAVEAKHRLDQQV